MVYGLLRSMIPGVCQSASLSVTQLHAALLCRHDWADRGPAWGRDSDSWEPKKYCIRRESRFPPRIRCSLCQITLATYYIEFLCCRQKLIDAVHRWCTNTTMKRRLLVWEKNSHVVWWRPHLLWTNRQRWVKSWINHGQQRTSNYNKLLDILDEYVL